MLQVTGKSVLNLNVKQLQLFLDVLMPTEKELDQNLFIVLDARKIKSKYLEITTGDDGEKITVFTGALKDYGIKDQEFNHQLYAGQLQPDTAVLGLLFVLYGIKKARKKELQTVKTTESAINTLFADPDFKIFFKNIGAFYAKYQEQAVNISPEDLMESARGGKANAEVSPYKNVPLGEVPLIAVPEDLDLRLVI